MYHYSGYWMTWSRVLLDNFNGQFIELNLTDINGDWSRVRNETIRVHSSPRKPGGMRGDKTVTELPKEVRDAMLKNLGTYLTNQLLTFDYLPHVDWTAYKRLCKGGTAFAGVRRRPY